LARARRGGKAAQIAFEGAATIRQVADHATRLREALATGPELVIDVAAVTAADLSFIQLIEAARVSCAERGTALRLAQPADGALRETLSRGGFLDPAQPQRTQFWIHTAEAP
jgi:anti-anti-sigma regulatory factor